MNGFMLDSNVLIDIAREPEGPVARNFETKMRGDIGISLIVAGEIRYGMQKRPQARSNSSMAFLLGSLRIDSVEPPVDSIYGSLRHELEMSGKSMSANDYWIAAHAIAKDAVLVTGDRAIHEACVRHLKLEDWRKDYASHRQE